MVVGWIGGGAHATLRCAILEKYGIESNGALGDSTGKGMGRAGGCFATHDIKRIFGGDFLTCDNVNYVRVSILSNVFPLVFLAFSFLAQDCT
jgi:hypothetical protein